MKPTVLVADDEETILTLLKFNLGKLGYEIVTALDGERALELMHENVGTVLLDLKMPKLDGMGALKRIRESHPDVPVIMISAHGQIEDAVAAMKLGALEYVTKPFDLQEVVCLVRNSMALWRRINDGEQVRRAVTDSETETTWTGRSEYAAQLASRVKKLGGLDSTVLITGESGTGKSHIARRIHKAGPRKDKPFVAVSCPSLPGDLLESEMFGHEKGAFTGALQRRIGRVEMAHGGTLFLDEIGDLPLSLQPKLLTFLQDREFQRLGGSETLSADIRLIAATNIDLKESVANGEFREDLYFRVDVLGLELEPLRRRGDDVLQFTDLFLSKINKRRGRSFRLGTSGRQALLRHRWPGNIRELENVLERATAFCEGDVIESGDLPDSVQSTRDSDDVAGGGRIPEIAGLPLAVLEREAIRQTLALHKGNKLATARALGISDRGIYNKLARHGLG